MFTTVYKTAFVSLTHHSSISFPLTHYLAVPSLKNSQYFLSRIHSTPHLTKPSQANLTSREQESFHFLARSTQTFRAAIFSFPVVNHMFNSMRGLYQSLPPSPPAWAYSTLFASGFQVKGYSMPSPFVPLLFASVTVRSWAPQS